jgi:hypothetical protein
MEEPKGGEREREKDEKEGQKKIKRLGRDKEQDRQCVCV